MNINVKIADLFLYSVMSGTSFVSWDPQSTPRSSRPVGVLQFDVRQRTINILPKKKDLSLPPNMTAVDRSKLPVSIKQLSTAMKKMGGEYTPINTDEFMTKERKL